ncbi:MAG: hypothetical protein ACR2NM_16735, partial [Bythopirellula sp.]
MKTALAIGLLVIAPLRASLATDSAVVVFTQPVVERQPIYLAPQQADDFALSGGAQITAIRFWGGYGIASTPASEEFEVSFFAAADAQVPDDPTPGGRPPRPPILDPESTPFVSFSPLSGARAPTDFLTFPGHTVFVFDLQLPQPVAVRASETYFLSLTYLPPRPWAWSGAGGDRHRYRLAETESWISRGPDLAFELIGTPI